MIGGHVGRPVANVDGPRQTDADADDVTEAPAGSAHEHPAAIDDPRQHLLRAHGDIEVDDLVGEHIGGEVADREVHVGCPDIDAEDEPRRGLKAKRAGGRPPLDVASTGSTDQLDPTRVSMR